MTDPLAGMRQSINTGARTTLTWVMVKKAEPCPVGTGDTFDLRDCSIEITRTERTHRKGKHVWVALFTRYPRRADWPHLLAANGDGYTSDPRRALGLGEEIFDEDQRTDEHKNAGAPLEPEAIPHREVMASRATAEAHQRFVLELGAERVAEQGQPLELRLARLRAMSRGRQVDISSDLRVIERRIEQAERKLERRAA